MDVRFFPLSIPMTLCFMCRQTEVPKALWNRPCAKCKEKLKAASHAATETKVEVVKLGNRLPAARIEQEATRMKPKADIYVDKYGREVTNPGYDPVHDPRGGLATGTAQKKGVMII